MSELAPISTVPEPNYHLPVLSSPETKRHLLAALLSCIVPGAGQVFLGQRNKGIILLIILTAVLVGFWPLRLLSFYVGFVFLLCSWIVLYLYAAISAFLTRNPQTGLQPSRWWLVSVVPVAVLTMSLLGRGVTRASGFRAFSMPSISMEATVRKGDQIVADMHYYRSRLSNREDVILFMKDGTFFIKRVIATGGDTIEGRNGEVVVNGRPMDEPYVQHTSAHVPQWMITFGPVTVPNRKYFVMGDNRDESLDSRSPDFRMVDDSSVAGKALYVYTSDRTGRKVR